MESAAAASRSKAPTRGFVARLTSLLIFAASALGANTYTVTNTNDSGAGSLRQAITDANANAGMDTIAFDIPGSGVQTIAIAGPLPSVTSPVLLDGFSQPGSSANTNGPGLPDNSVHRIEIDATNCNAPFIAGVLVFAAGSGGSTVRGLVINRCATRTAIAFLNTGGGNHVEGCFLGTDAAGAAAMGNAAGVDMEDQGSSEAGDVVGGLTPAARNLISGNGAGVLWSNAGGTGHFVEGNLIGTDASGAAALPNGDGVHASYNTGNVTIGGTTAAARNVISGNTNAGITLANAFPAGIDGFQIQGNYIGTELTGTTALPNGKGVVNNAGTNTIGGGAAGAGNVISGNNDVGIAMGSGTVVKGNAIGLNAQGDPLPNKSVGIFVYGSGCTIGGTAAGEGNTIAYNGAIAPNGAGVLLNGGGVVHIAVRGNSIYANSSTGSLANRGLGIDLNNDGPTPNDAQDADGGDNGSQNYPLLVSAAPNGSGGTHVTGVLDSAPSTQYALDFFSDPGCLSRTHDFFEARNYLGSFDVTTDGSGHATFDHDLPVAIEAGDPVTATATDPDGNTSELSPRLAWTINPSSGPAAGGTGVTIAGTSFADGATVTIGGQAPSGVTVSGPTQITATTPALAAGGAYDVSVTNADGTNGTIMKGFIADFADVPGGNQFHQFVATLVSNAITAGIGGGLYGVDDDTLRQQMAVFLLKGKHGLCYTPPPCTGTFPDVPCPSTFANWIEALAAEGITGGCGGGNYCPASPVRRDQMAVFLLKAEHGSSYVPPTCTGMFGDVPCPSTFADWIERLAAEQITGGCGNGNYCPQNPNTRGQMAVFITKTFGLQ